MQNYYIEGKFIFNELKDLFSKMSNIPYVLIKGEALSLQAYGKCGMRKYGDVDILTTRKYLKELEQILDSSGFSCNHFNKDNRAERALCLAASHQLKTYTKQSKSINILIDVNFDLFWGQYRGKRIDVDSFISNSHVQSIYGQKLNILLPEYALIQLILHHFKELNSLYTLFYFNTIKTDMFKDVYYLLLNNSKIIPPEYLHQLCIKYNIVEYAYYVMYYTSKCYKDENLNEYIKLLESDKGKEYLDYYGLDERKKWTINFEQRLDCNNLYKYILPELNSTDREKLELNCKIFM